MADLDEFDRKMIALLRTDGRAPVTTLARQLGVSRATVNSRLERLLESGKVLGFTVRIRDDHGDDDVRAAAAEAAGKSGNEMVIRPLLKLRRHKDPLIKTSALLALARSNLKGATGR